MGRVWLAAAATAALAAVGSPGAVAQPVTARVSYEPDGSERMDGSFDPAISSDGDVVVYEVIRGDPEESRQGDIYAYDRTTGKTDWISAGPLGTQGDGSSENPAVSADGRFVAFASSSDNLVTGDSDDRWDVFVRDRSTGELERIADTSGSDAHLFEPAISPGGRYVAFAAAPTSGGSYHQQVYVHDRQTGHSELVSGSHPTFDAGQPSLSAGGRLVAFKFAGGITVLDRTTGARESVPSPTRGACPSSKGPIWGRLGPLSEPAISATGRFVAFTKDTRSYSDEEEALPGDVFVYDRSTGRVRCMSVSSRGRRGNDLSGGPSISPKGRYVAFGSDASNLARHDTNGAADVFVRDRRTRTTRRVSISTARNEGNAASGTFLYGPAYYGFESSIAGGGGFVAFPSAASNLVGSDTNQAVDVFVRGPLHP